MDEKPGVWYTEFKLSPFVTDGMWATTGEQGASL